MPSSSVFPQYGSAMFHNGPWYPEAFGHPGPMVMIGAIASRTKDCAWYSTTVLTLRHPLHIAKSAISLDHLSHGRFVLIPDSDSAHCDLASLGSGVALVQDRRKLAT